MIYDAGLRYDCSSDGTMKLNCTILAQWYREADMAVPQLIDTVSRASGEDFMAQPINRRSDFNVGRIVLFCVAAVVLLVFVLTHIW